MGAGEQLAHPGRRRLVVGAHHDALGMQAVGDGRALPQELGVGDHLTSLRPRTRSTTRVEPTGTVDLLTMTVPGRQERADLGGHRLDVGEVGRAVVALGGRHAQEHELGTLARPRWHRARTAGCPAAWPSRTSSSRCSSTMGTSPRCSMATLAGSASPQVTRWPRWASVAAVGRPT